VVLLFGPPGALKKKERKRKPQSNQLVYEIGTGKTSICKALAQKLAIRFAHRYQHTYLIEVNSQAIFSKWFSESARMVGKLFDLIFDLASSNDTLVLVLVDEVESLASSRTRSSSSEPSDALRVVNYIQPQLDRLKNFSNALLLCTSIVTEILDTAFLDRADFKLFIGPPSTEAFYEMLRSAMTDLMRVGIVQGQGLAATFKEALVGDCDSQNLAKIAQLCGSLALSGRFARKLPLQTHAKYIGTDKTVAQEAFLKAMALTVQDESKKEL